MYGGFCILVTNVQLGNLLTKGRNIMICIMNGSFDSSSFITLVVKLLYKGGVTLRVSFITISATYIICLVSTCLWLPRKIIPYPLSDDFEMKIRFLCKPAAVKKKNEKQKTLNDGKINNAFELDTNNKSVQIGAKCQNLRVSNAEMSVDDITLNKEDGYSMEPSQLQPLKAALLSSLFWTDVLWFVSNNLRVAFFLGNFNSWITFLTKGNTQNVSLYTSVFSSISLTSIIVSILAGAIIDRRTTAPVGSLAFKLEKLRHFIPMFYLNIGLGVLLSACAAIPVLELQYFTFVVFVFHRTFIY
ncbi:unnamed protein product, partial [Owenia fusiformis]